MMIPEELKTLAEKLDLESDEQFKLRVEFGVCCIQRVKAFITQDQIVDALAIGERFTRDECGPEALRNAAELATKAAQSHAGSGSLDGSGNAAVSVSLGVAAALCGRALEASEYAAYAAVYSYASYAVTDLSAYLPEQNWQISKLKELAKCGQK